MYVVTCIPAAAVGLMLIGPFDDLDEAQSVADAENGQVEVLMPPEAYAVQ